MLKTETPSTQHAQLDLYSVEALVGALIDDQSQALQAVQAAAPSITAAVEAMTPRIAAGGRLIYVGAGTSGRLGILDSVELFPTFSWPHQRAVALRLLYPVYNDVVLLMAASRHHAVCVGRAARRRARWAP